MEILRKVNQFTLRKVQRNFSGSYAIFNGDQKSKIQYNAGTVKVLMQMADYEFEDYSKAISYSK